MKSVIISIRPDCGRKLVNKMTEFLRQCAEKDTLTAEDRKRLVEVADKVTEVVHAEWIEFQGEYHCSHCNKLAPLNAYRKHTMRNDYCQSCGAKMDKECDHNEN